jgi:hypothetical protein
MITEDEVFDMALRAAAKIAEADAVNTMVILQMLIFDAYEKGMRQGFESARAAQEKVFGTQAALV